MNSTGRLQRSQSKCVISLIVSFEGKTVGHYQAVNIAGLERMMEYRIAAGKAQRGACPQAILELRSAAAGFLALRLVPLTARVDAFMSAMRRAPVMLGPSPMDVANAGTRISDANARPVPRMSDPDDLVFRRGDFEALGEDMWISDSW